MSLSLCLARGAAAVVPGASGFFSLALSLVIPWLLSIWRLWLVVVGHDHSTFAARDNFTGWKLKTTASVLTATDRLLLIGGQQRARHPR